MQEQIKARVAALTASRDARLAKLQRLLEMTQEERQQIERHTGAIEELQGLLGQTESPPGSSAENPAESSDA